MALKRTPIARKTPLRRSTKTIARSGFVKQTSSKVRKVIYNVPKLWSTDKADRHFSIKIRERDGHCLRCGTTQDLTNSHYWRRGHSGTRFDFENCITLCLYCHADWEHQKNEAYRDFMLERLGEKKYLELELRARRFKNRGVAVREYMELVGVT